MEFQPGVTKIKISPGTPTSALGQIGSERAIDALLQALTTDSNTNFISQAAWVLGNLEGKRKSKINQTTFRNVTEILRRLLDQPGFDEGVCIIIGSDLRHYSHCYDVIWEALWNLCQKHGLRLVTNETFT
jgi:hypothetical protein